MPDQPYTAREGIYRATYGGRKWLAASPPGGAAFGGERKPCLVVTGDLDVVRRRLDPPPTLPSFRKVAGTCPACSGSTLMLGAGDRVTCSLIGCPDPMAASRLIDSPPPAPSPVPFVEFDPAWADEADAREAAPANDDATARYLEWRRVREDAIARAGGSCASDDVKARTRAYDVAFAECDSAAYSAAIVDALAAAGLLAAPSHLDRLAAWADEHDASLTVERDRAGGWSIIAYPPLDDCLCTGADPQEAARRVLARLEATDE